MSNASATQNPANKTTAFDDIDGSTIADLFMCDYIELNDYDQQHGTYAKWTVDIGQLPRELSDLIEFSEPDATGEEYEDLGEIEDSWEDCTEDHGEDGGCSNEILLITSVIPKDAYDDVPMPWPYRLVISGCATYPSYCDDESDGYMHGTICLIPDDEDLIEKLEQEHADSVATEIHRQFVDHTRNILALRPQDVLLCKKELETLNRAYAKALSAAAVSKNDSDIDKTQIEAGQSVSAQESDVLSPVIAQVSRLSDLPDGETAYLHMPGDYHDLCKDIADNIQNSIGEAGYVSGVWGVGGIPDGHEVVLVINKERNDELDGAMSINSAGRITWRPRRSMSHTFSSETDQLMAATDPWRLIEELLGFSITEKWQALADRLKINPKLTKVSERVNVAEIEFERQG